MNRIAAFQFHVHERPGRGHHSQTRDARRTLVMNDTSILLDPQTRADAMPAPAECSARSREYSKFETLTTLLDLIYPRPKPLLRLEEWDREHHNDLASFSDRDLLMERDRVWLRLILERSADGDWMFE